MRPSRTTMSIAAAITAAAVILIPLSRQPSTPAEAMGKIKCADNTPHVIKTIDPIVNHNQVGASHEHQFFGNIAWLSNLSNPNTANYTDLAGHPTNCRLLTDTAGYWTPTLMYTSGSKAGQVIPVQQFTAYYRSFDRQEFGQGQAFPADTRLIGTDYNWTCGQKSGSRAEPVSSVPDCSGLSGKPGLTLTAHIFFPQCWDGVKPTHTASQVGDTQDTAHYRYTVRKTCPAGFSNKMSYLNETIQFEYVGNGNDVGLSSDMHAGVTDGRSLHGDFWNTWNQPGFETFIHDCVNVQSSFTTAKCQP